MARQRAMKGTGDIVLDLGKLNPKQIEFFNSTTKFTCYGGAKGGGKSHAVIRLAIMYCINYPGIKVLIIRAHYPELSQNLIEPMLALLPQEMTSYNGTTHVLTFYNGSVVRFGHWSGMESENEYQGQSHDIICMDEATQFSERTFRHLAACLRGDNDFPKRFYLTCNPGGVGHFWVKRLFIDRKFKVDKEHPEKTENPDQYSFIFARAEDNVIMLQRNPDYLSDISMMANSDAMRYGDWNILGGCYFDNFSTTNNIHKAFKIPPHWQMYRSFDYGLDMFACFWWAVDEDGRCWCIREYEMESLNIQDAAREALTHTLKTEKISVTFAPPDMWNRQKESGKTMAEIFANYGLPIVRSDNNRVQGHMIMRSMLEPIPLHDPYVIKIYGGKDKAPKQLPQLMFFDGIGGVLEDIQSIQRDELNPNDCAKDPHDITHTVDGVRYFCINRSLQAQKPEKKKEPDEFFDEEVGGTYEDYMTGGEISEQYMNF
ncbi:MAG: phage terminase large subunit [Bacteroidales bacterium]|nr:phage terminase large subunit [Bacteroidales bacterium]